LDAGFNKQRTDNKTFCEELVTRIFLEIGTEKMLVLENCIRIKNYKKLLPYQNSHFMAATGCQLSLCN
jgi:hypothetical protein